MPAPTSPRLIKVRKGDGRTQALSTNASEKLRIVELLGDSVGDEERRQLLHDVTNATYVIAGCADALRRGYRFDDHTADQRIVQLEKAAQSIQRFVSECEDLLR